MKRTSLPLLLGLAFISPLANAQSASVETPPVAQAKATSEATTEKLKSIVLPSVTFNGVPLDRCLQTLGFISAEFDGAATGPKGVKFTIKASADQIPSITGRFENQTVEQILSAILPPVKFRHEVVDGVVVVTPEK